MSDQAAELLARNAYPIRGIVRREVNKLYERGIEDQFRHANRPEDGYCKTGHVDRCEIAKSAELLVENLDDSRSLDSISMNDLVYCLPSQQRHQLREGAVQESLPASDKRTDDQRKDGEVTDDYVEERRTTAGLRKPPTRDSQAWKEMQEPSPGEQPD